MRFLVLACLALAAVSADQLGPQGGVCEPGSVSKEDCNTCVCSKDGRFRSCTLMLCPLGTISNPRSRRQAAVKVCEPGSRKMDECNSCFCLGDGSAWACSLMACPPGGPIAASPKNPQGLPNDLSSRKRRQASDDRPCVPGERFKSYCNTCTCGSDGFSVVCTRKACPKEIFNEDGSLKRPEQVTAVPLLRQRRQASDDRTCVPGERFKSYCNTCTCGSDGFSVVCTRKACPREIFNEDGSLKRPEQVTAVPLLRQRRQASDDRTCVPGERFKSYCNTCTCGSDGFSVVCTKKACPREIFNEDGSLKRAEPLASNLPLPQRRQVAEEREEGVIGAKWSPGAKRTPFTHFSRDVTKSLLG